MVVCLNPAVCGHQEREMLKVGHMEKVNLRKAFQSLLMGPQTPGSHSREEYSVWSIAELLFMPKRRNSGEWGAGMGQYLVGEFWFVANEDTNKSLDI